MSAAAETIAVSRAGTSFALPWRIDPAPRITRGELPEKPQEPPLCAAALRPRSPGPVAVEGRVATGGAKRRAGSLA